jgi:hypothetical protein
VAVVLLAEIMEVTVVAAEEVQAIQVVPEA